MIAIPQNIVVVDVETSGLDPRIHGILEIGAVKMATGDEFTCEVRLEDDMVYDQGVYRVNGIAEERARSSERMSVEAALFELFGWLSPCPDGGKGWLMAGSNPRFDDGFLRAAYGDDTAAKYPFLRHLLDLQTVAFTYFVATGTPMPKSLSADAIYRAVGLPEEPKPHQALRGARYEAHGFHTIFNRLAAMNRLTMDGTGQPFTHEAAIVIPEGGS